MGIGLGVVLLLLGLILALGVIDLPASLDDVVATSTLGWILIIVGALAIILALVGFLGTIAFAYYLIRIADDPRGEGQ